MFDPLEFWPELDKPDPVLPEELLPNEPEDPVPDDPVVPELELLPSEELDRLSNPYES